MQIRSINISDVIIPPDRQRKSFSSEHIDNLRASFREVGILQAPVLRNDAKTLVIGECRLRAARAFYSTHPGEQLAYGDYLLPPNHIPFCLLGDLSPLELYQAELQENTHRSNLTVTEEAIALTKYYELRKGATPEVPDIDILREINPDLSPQTRVTGKIRSAKLISENAHIKEVANAKSAAEAMRFIEREQKKAVTSLLASSTAPYTGDHTHLLGDARTLLPTFPDKEFNCILSDPPYGVGADGFHRQEAGHNYDDSHSYWQGLMRAVIPELFRISASESHLYLFCDPRRFEELSLMVREAGFSPWHRPLIWHKSVGSAAGVGILPRPEHAPRNTYDCILYALKGDKKVLRVASDVIPIPLLTEPGHAARKPVELYENLLSRSCYPGEKVLDFCAGSGPIFPAANRLKLSATGINLNSDDYNTAQLRLEEDL